MAHEETKNSELDLVNEKSRLKSLKGALAVLFVFTISIVATVTIQNNLEQISLPAFSDEQRPVTSMAFLRRTNNVQFVSCVPSPVIPEGAQGFNPCGLFNDNTFVEQVTMAMDMQFGYSITGSAIVVGHDLSRSASYVLSAYHVCRDFNQRYIAVQIQDTFPHTLIFKFDPSVTITDFYGNEYAASEVRGDIDNDLCLLESQEMMDGIQPVRIAEEPPSPGDRIYNVASPHGLSQPGAVLSYEGYHAGTIRPNRVIRTPHYLNAVPTAPGSSGSAILNEAGEIVSITSYGYIQRPNGPVPPHDMWPNASAGASLDAIRQLVMPRIIQ